MSKKSIYGKSVLEGLTPIQETHKTYQWTRCVDDAFTMSIGKFETCQCNVEVFSTPYAFRQERIYIVVSVRRKDGRELIRFGNRQQTQNIIESYNLGSKKPEIDWQ